MKIMGACLADLIDSAGRQFSDFSSGIFLFYDSENVRRAHLCVGGGQAAPRTHKNGKEGKKWEGKKGEEERKKEEGEGKEEKRKGKKKKGKGKERKGKERNITSKH